MNSELDNADRKYLYEKGFRDSFVAKYSDGKKSLYVVGADPNVRQSMTQQWKNLVGWRYCVKRKTGYYLTNDAINMTVAHKVEIYGPSRILYAPAWFGNFSVVPNGSTAMGVDDEVLDGELNDVR